MTRPRVSFVTRTIAHYRVSFHERVRRLLADAGIDYDVLHGAPARDEARKNDSGTLSFGRYVRNCYVPVGGSSVLYQPVLRHVWGSTLVVLDQESRLLANYVLLAIPRAMRPKLALFGHGRNHQSRHPDGLAERWKRRWAVRPDWWFAYTDGTRRHVASVGFPVERITTFNNTVDTSALRRDIAELTDEQLAARRADLGLSGNNVCIFVGGIYPDKRPDFLMAAADRIRADVPDFELLIVGGGATEEIARFAATRSWIKVLGPRFGTDKAALLGLCKLFMMPGLLGLAVLDAAAAGLPVVTTAYPYHSPEIAYLEDGVGGVIVSDWRSEQAYAAAVTSLLHDGPRRVRMAAAARRIAERYTIEAMVERFTQGVLAALAER